MFKDRKDAGEELAKKLAKYKNKNVLVLAIPRGGVEVGYYVAKFLHADLSLVISRKLPYPYEPEAGFGAIAEDGSFVIDEDIQKWLSDDEIDKIKKEQVQEIKRRIRALRRGKTLPKISERTVILIDDGLAMGSTMKAAIMLCRKKRAKKIVVAVPVAGDRAAREIEEIANETVILEIPRFFRAVAQVYENWHDVSDEEVPQILAAWKTKQKIQNNFLI